MTLLHAWLIEPFGYDFMQRGLLSALLLSISGGAPVQLFGEWLDDGLLPLGLWHAGRYQSL